MIKNILFDLDGTLLPMDQEVFVKSYFSKLVKKLAPLGYDPEKVVAALWSGVKAMTLNDGAVTNEKVFWNKFTEIFGSKCLKDLPVFDEFYSTDFNLVSKDCGYNPESEKLISRLKAEGFKLILATNPLFPAVATEARIRWAGLNKTDFELVTTYENSSFCKPNPKYYKEILDKLALNPEECLMVGNDMAEDTAAEELGVKVFILTDSLIEREEKELKNYPNGSFNELLEYINKNK